MEGNKDNRERKEIEIPDTWIDFIMYPAGMIIGVILAAIVEFFLAFIITLKPLKKSYFCYIMSWYFLRKDIK